MHFHLRNQIEKTDIDKFSMKNKIKGHFSFQILLKKSFHFDKNRIQMGRGRYWFSILKVGLAHSCLGKYSNYRKYLSVFYIMGE